MSIDESCRLSRLRDKRRGDNLARVSNIRPIYTSPFPEVSGEKKLEDTREIERDLAFARIPEGAR